MKFIIRNNARIANKYIRFAKWKIRALNKTFQQVLYSEIFIKSEGNRPQLYSATIKLGVAGPDIIISAKSDNLNQLWSVLSRKVKQQLRKQSDKKVQRRLR